MKAAFIASTMGILGVLNWMIIDKEVLLGSAQSIYLELAPVDPRSLMQGDYMVLAYAATREAESNTNATLKTGHLILRLDGRRVGQFARIDDGSPLAENEVRVRFTRNHGIQIGAESFFFEEGTGDVFAQAKFAELKVGSGGACVLVGLLDEDLKPIDGKD